MDDATGVIAGETAGSATEDTEGVDKGVTRLASGTELWWAID